MISPELRDMWLIATIITMDGEELAEGNVKLGNLPGHGTFQPQLQKGYEPSLFIMAKSLIVQIEKIQIETINWSVCSGSDNCPLSQHFHFLSSN